MAFQSHGTINGTSYGWSRVTKEAEMISQDEMRQEVFTTRLNTFIENTEDGIDKTGLCKWKTNAGDYPTLNFESTWNGAEWE